MKKMWQKFVCMLLGHMWIVTPAKPFQGRRNSYHMEGNIRVYDDTPEETFYTTPYKNCTRCEKRLIYAETYGRWI